MESCPSTVINTEVRETLVIDPLTTKPITFGFESPYQFKGLGDVEEVVTKASSSINLKKVGGRQNSLSNTKKWNGRRYDREESMAAAVVVLITSY